MKISAVVFDMDGVIFDSERLVYKCWVEIGPKYGFNTLDKLFYKIIGTNMKYTEMVFKEEYGKDIPYKEFRYEARKVYFDYIEKHGVPMKNGVKELLTYLKDNGYKVGLASSTSIETVIKELKMSGIYEYFGVIVGGDLLKRSKPEPDIYLTACDKLGVKPENALAIEDSYNGIRAAYAAKMYPIMVPDIVEANDEMREMAYCIKADLYEVKELIEKEIFRK